MKTELCHSGIAHGGGHIPALTVAGLSGNHRQNVKWPSGHVGDFVRALASGYDLRLLMMGLW